MERDLKMEREDKLMTFLYKNKTIFSIILMAIGQVIGMSIIHFLISLQ